MMRILISARTDLQPCTEQSRLDGGFSSRTSFVPVILLLLVGLISQHEVWAFSASTRPFSRNFLQKEIEIEQNHISRSQSYHTRPASAIRMKHYDHSSSSSLSEGAFAAWCSGHTRVRSSRKGQRFSKTYLYAPGFDNGSVVNGTQTQGQTLNQHQFNTQSDPQAQTQPQTQTNQATQTSSSEADKNTKKNSENKKALEEELNLYEILGTSPNATKSELKRSYAKLAKQTHPDAILQQQNNGDSPSSQVTFQQVSEAYKLLSDPFKRKRYDRELKAKALTNEIEAYVEDFGRKAAPEVSRVFQRVVNPILRRGAVTTMAGINAVVQDAAGGRNKTKKNGVKDNSEIGSDGGSNNDGVGQSKDLGSILDRAVKAGQKAGKYIDRLELVEKSKELQERAMVEERKVLSFKDKLSEVMTKRIRLSLQTPHSNLSSLDALQLLDGMNTIDQVSTIDRVVRLRHTISYEIELLEQCETEYKSLHEQDQVVQKEVRESQAAIEKARKNVEAALVAEARARKALEDAIALVESTKQDVVDCSRSLNVKEELSRRTGAEVEKLSTILHRRQERVRMSLKRKEEEIEMEKANANGASISNGGSDDVNGATTAAMAPSANELGGQVDGDNLMQDELTEIEQYRKEEKFLLAESARLEDKAMRLRSRSGRLIERAESIERDEELVSKLEVEDVEDFN